MKPNRSTCFIKEYDDGTISIRNNGAEMENEVWLNTDEMRFIREYLNAGVIQELERRMKVCAKHSAFDKENIYEQAISLLKGVKE